MLFSLWRVGARKGVTAVASTFTSCLRDGSGLRGFLLWLRDSCAFEQRDDAAAYRRWLRSRPVPVSAANEALARSCLRIHSWGDFRRAYDGDFVIFSDKDAEVSGPSLARLLAVAEERAADVVYADEDQLGEDGPHSPQFKPGFSVDLLRSHDYIGPVFLARVDALLRVIDVVPPTGGTHALLLRLAEAGARFERVGEVLVHWHRLRGHDAVLAPAALEEHLQRCYGDDLGTALCGHGNRNEAGQVSIVIPTRDREALLAACIESIYATDAGMPFEVILLDNDSRTPGARAWLEAAPERYANLRVVSANYPFNWSRLNNHGLSLATGDFLLFLNNDVEARGDGWLKGLALQARRPDIGAVGPLLLYPDETIQHAGVVVGMGGFADHVYSGCSPGAELRHPFVHPRLPRNVLAVTGACLMVSRADCELVGGFDEDLAICGDIDICLRLHEAGRLNLYEPRVELLHHESATRRRSPMDPEEVRRTRRLLAEFLEAGDPYYNPQLSLHQRYPCFAI